MAEGEVTYEIRGDDSHLDEDLDAAQKKVERSAKESGKATEKVEESTAENVKAVKEEVTDHHEKQNDQRVKSDEDAGKKREEVEKNTGERIKSIASGTAKVVGSAMLAAGTAAVAIGTKAVSSANSLDQAMNQYISSTGKSVEETERYQKVMEDIYTNNYGESFDDISDAMAQVNKQLGDMSDEQLQTVTESAFALRDTFEYDVAESTRAAKAMMDNFGVSGDKAMGLIAAGAQNGLDYSGELLDSISEYSVQFAKVGLDADDMFKIFEQGAETGAWNLDKIGDAVKEMSIRVIDGSDTTKEGFKTIGLNADEMAAKFSAGGESAKEAFQETIAALASMEDPLAQNTAGVDLFGTMWEDLGPEVVTQLANIESGAYDTADAMGSIKKVKYNDLGSMFSALMRSVEMLLIPLGESLIPVLTEIIEDVLPALEESFPPLIDLIGETIEQIMPVVEELLPVLIELIQELLPPFMRIMDEILPVLIELVSTLAPLIGDFIDAVLPILIELFNSLIPPLMEIVSALLPPLISLVNALLPIFQSLIALLQPIIGLFTSLLAPIVNVIQSGITPLIGVIGQLINGAVGPLQSAISVMADVVGGILDGFLTDATAVFNNLQQIFQGIIDFIGGIFTGDWTRVWEGVKSIFSGICDAIGNIFKRPINFIIDGINGFIRGLNKIKIPDWVPLVGGKGFNISEIPRLKVGIDYVPSDYYPAFLDAGERVLTAEENAKYTAFGGVARMEAMLGREPVDLRGSDMTVWNRQNDSQIDYDKMANANAKAMEGMKVECDKREFGRIVREVQE